MSTLFSELKHRKVFRVSGTYIVVAWLSIQIANAVFPALQLPDWTVTFIIVLAILGFPLVIVLAWAFEVTPDGAQLDTGDLHQRPVSTPSLDRKLIYATFLLVLLVAGFQMVDRFMFPARAESNSLAAVALSGNSGVLRASINLGETDRQTLTNMRNDVAISRDGSRLAWTSRSGSRSGLYTRAFSDTEPTLLFEINLSSDALFGPVFSPNGESIVFGRFGTATWFTIPTSGGRIRPVTDRANLAMGINWLDNESIVFTHDESGSFYRVDVNSGEIQSMDIPMAPGERQSWPSVTTDGQWLIYTVVTSDFYEGRVDAFHLETGEIRHLVERGYNARYLPSGHIVFMRDENLWAMPCKLANSYVCLKEVQLENNIENFRGFGKATYAISDTGRLIYQLIDESNDARGKAVLSWHTLAGMSIEHSIPSTATQVRFSPSSNELLMTIAAGDAGEDIAIYDIATGALARRTFTSSASNAIWSPDARKFVYSTNASNEWRLYASNADGSGQADLLVTSTEWLAPNSFTSDGAELVYTVGVPDARKIFVMSLIQPEKPSRRLMEEATVVSNGQLSPDGRWMAYTSFELGRLEVFLRPFPNIDDGKWQISYEGGTDPLWSQDGRSLFFLDLKDGIVKRLPIEASSGVIMGSQQPVSKKVSWSLVAQIQYSLSPNDEQIIYYQSPDSNIATPRSPAVLEIVDAWFDRLNQLAPAEL